MNLSYRSSEPELMDSEGEETEIRNALRELKIINRLLGGNTVSASAIDHVRRKYSLKKISIMDAGSGASDILFHNGIKGIIKIISLDKNKLICEIVKENNKTSEVVCGDVLSLPYKKGSFDIIHSSLFFHHFDQHLLRGLTLRLCEVAKYAVVINDIHRSYFAYYGFKLLSGLFSNSRLVRHDGPLSVKRAFKKEELYSWLNATGFKFEIKWQWAFRWRIIIYCDERI